MTKINDLTQGSISKGIWSMAIPLITASFVQMAYSMTDMIWLGHLGSESVAAVGVAGFFTWLGNALSFISKVGAEVTISQSLGARASKRTRAYANQSAMLSSIIALGYACFIYIAAPMLVGLFHLEENISELSIMYMRLITPGLFFTFNNNTYSGLYNGQGNSKTPLKIVATGLIFNIILDPLLIYGYSFVPAMGTAGAAIATTFSQLVVFSIFIYNLYFRNSSIGKLYFVTRLRARFVKRVVSLGLPVSMQSALFAMFSLTLATVGTYRGCRAKRGRPDRGDHVDDRRRFFHRVGSFYWTKLRSPQLGPHTLGIPLHVETRRGNRLDRLSRLSVFQQRNIQRVYQRTADTCCRKCIPENSRYFPNILSHRTGHRRGFQRLRTYHPARHRGNHPHGSQNPVGLLLGFLPHARPKRHLVEHLDLQRDEGHRAGYLVSIISKTPTKWTLQTHWNPRKNARRGKSSLAAI